MYEKVFEGKEGFALVEVAEHVIELPATFLRPAVKVAVGKVTYFGHAGSVVEEAVHMVEVKKE